MNSCMFGFHKWNEYLQKVSLVWRGDSHGEADINVRMCSKCHKKQKYDTISKEWRLFEKYSKEEKREISLKKILGEDG